MNRNTSKIKKIKRVLTPVTRWTPRIKPALKPVNDIKESDCANTGCWTSIGDDPQFRLQFPISELAKGWYMVSIEIEASNVFDIAKIYFDQGDGFLEDKAIRIPTQSRKPTKRFFCLQEGVRAVRFDPFSGAGDFSIKTFTISPVTFGFAESRMLKKLQRWCPSSSGDNVVSTRALVKKQALDRGVGYVELLERRYSALFSDPSSANYSDWIDNIEIDYQPSGAEVTKLKETPESPRISVLVPTYNTDPELLDKTLHSVFSQSYTNWQICIADDGSSNPQTIEVIRHWQDKDPRIQATLSDETNGISLNTNAALSLADGEYVVFLDHDDLLTEHALFEVAQCVSDNPDLKLVYSDEDKLDVTGERTEPHFKPDWNPDLLLSQNYICHLVALDRSLVEKLGGCRTGYEGAQDHDLLIRVMESIQANQVKHIPKVLYHWRITAESTAATPQAKSYSTDRGIAAITDHLNRTGAKASVEPGRFANTYRVLWGFDQPEPTVSIIIPTRDRRDILSQCIESVLNFTEYSNYEIVVVNNESVEPDTLEYFQSIKTLPNVRIIDYGGAFNYSAINNYAVDQVQSDVIVLMNNDIEVISTDWLKEMVGHASRDEIGCVGAKLLYKNNMIQHGGVILGIGGVAGHAHKYYDSESAGYFSRLHLTQNYSAVTAACLCVKREIYQQVGGLNEEKLKVAFNDVDFCLKVGALGLRNLWTPYATLYHHESISRGHEDTQEKLTRFNNESKYMQDQWGEVLSCDPAYNKNLTLAREDFSLAA